MDHNLTPRGELFTLEEGNEEFRWGAVGNLLHRWLGGRAAGRLGGWAGGGAGGLARGRAGGWAARRLVRGQPGGCGCCCFQKLIILI